MTYGSNITPAKPAGLTVTVINGPPLPPIVNVIPYANTNNKVLFMFEKANGIQKVTATPNIKMEYAAAYKQQQNSTPRGSDYYQLQPDQMFFGCREPKPKHVHGDQKDEEVKPCGPIEDFIVYRISGIRPKSLRDFGSPYAVVPIARGTFIDFVEPNVQYYYAFRARTQPAITNQMSFVENFHIVELTDEAGTILPRIDIERFELEKDFKTSIEFRKRLKISPAFLQAIPNPKKGISGDLGVEDKSVWQPVPNKDRTVKKEGDDMPRWKFRIISNSTQRKIDLNVFFRKNVEKYQPITEEEKGGTSTSAVTNKTITVDPKALKKLRELNLREDVAAGIYEKILSFDKG